MSAALHTLLEEEVKIEQEIEDAKKRAEDLDRKYSRARNESLQASTRLSTLMTRLEKTQEVITLIVKRDNIYPDVLTQLRASKRGTIKE